MGKKNNKESPTMDNVKVVGTMNIHALYDMLGRILSEQYGVDIKFTLIKKDEETIQREREAEKNGVQVCQKL